MIPSANKILSSYNIKFSKIFIDTYTSDLDNLNFINNQKEDQSFQFNDTLELKNLSIPTKIQCRNIKKYKFCFK